VNADQSANYTKVKAQELQQTLYLAAKENPQRRFHALYDKVCRKDIMTEAWKRVKANKGSAGIDKMSIAYIVNEYGEERIVEEAIQALREGTYHPLPARRKEIPKGDGKVRNLSIPAVRDRMVQMATKLVIEGIFEADFKDCSYGFRPKRNMHQALRQIRKTIHGSKIYWVVDIDITGYFDNIPHEKLMKLVEQRISDRRILKLIRKWLKVGFEHEGVVRGAEIGSGQGSVISPLLSNIYLNYLDTIWEKRFTEIGTLVRFADDLVILCYSKKQALEAIDVLKAVFKKLELTMNTTKSKLVNLATDEEGFDFLGYHHRKLPNFRKSGAPNYILRSFPSKKAMMKMKTVVKEETAPRNRLPWSLNEIVKILNPKIQGWKNYYSEIDPGCSNRFLSKIDWYIRKRLKIFWNKKHKKKKTGHFDFHRALTQIGLKTTSSWGQPQYPR
jgi:RNA-directed DNA polymerase